MPSDLAAFITNYGYLAIFSLVFLQEIGIPNPVPNELVLMFAGYLAYAKILNFFLVFLAVVAADTIGTTVLYGAFYFFGEYLFGRKRRWLPISENKVQKFAEKIDRKGRWGIFLGRLVPYLRGYISIAAGLLRISPVIFITTVFVSGAVWSGGYATVGYIFGSYWKEIVKKVLGIQEATLVLIAAILLVILIRYLIKKNKKKIA